MNPSLIRDLEQRMIYKDIEISNLKRHVKELEHICMSSSQHAKENKVSTGPNILQKQMN